MQVFRAEYERAFSKHLANADESGLSDAYELGRTAMARRLSVLDIAAIHHEVLSAELQQNKGIDPGRAAAASAFFLEVLSTYEMVQRGAAEAHESARIEQRHAAQLRRLADASVAINAAGSVDEIARLLAEQAVRVLGAARVSVEVHPARGPRSSHVHPAGRPAARGRQPTLSAELLRRNDSVLGAMEVSAVAGGAFTENDEALVTQLAQVAGVALENMELYERERLVAETLQRSLLPRHLPEMADVAMAVRYLPGSREGAVGGDWYDALVRPDQRLALMVGDVMGKGVRAAAGMGQLRMALRAYAIEGHPPAVVMERLDRVLEELEQDLATAVYLLYDPATRSLAYANAGHPPPVLVSASGTATLLQGGLAPPLGAMIGATSTQAWAEVPPGATLVVYTDGLVERRGVDIERGIERLMRVASEVRRADLGGFCDALLAGMDADHRGDDVALLAVRFSGVGA